MTEKQDYIEMSVETLTGDLRDWLLGHLRNMPKPWQQLSEAEQKDRIYAAESAARDFVRKGVNLIAAHGHDKVTVDVGKFTVKDGSIKAEFVAAATDDNLLLIRHAGRAVLVLADPEVFTGERAPAAADPDEPELPIEEEDEGDEEPSSSGDFPEIPPHLDRRRSRAVADVEA